MEIYDMHQYIKRQTLRTTLNIAIFKRIFEYEKNANLSRMSTFPSLTHLKPRQNGRQFLDNLTCLFLNENIQISIKISLKFVPKGPINNIPALVQTVAWRRSGDKLSSEAMMVRFLNTLRPRQDGRHFPDDIFKCIFLNENVLISIKISLKFVPKGPINNIPALVQTVAWRRPGDKPLSEPRMESILTHICVTRPQWVKHIWVTRPQWVLTYPPLGPYMYVSGMGLHWFR